MMKFKLYASNITTDITFGSAEELTIFAFNRKADVDFGRREIYIEDDYYPPKEFSED